jgi:hypothetical protein
MAKSRIPRPYRYVLYFLHEEPVPHIPIPIKPQNLTRAHTHSISHYVFRLPTTDEVYTYLVNCSQQSQHLQSYPVVHDSLELYKTNPYGARSLSLFHDTYQRLIAPMHPYLQTPYSYLSPYLSRADELGDNGLSQVETRFPIVKEDTTKLKETMQTYASFPLRLAEQGKQYVFSTWEDEYQKTTGDESMVKNVRTLVSTELKIGLDGFAMLRDYWVQGKKEASKKADQMQK